MPGGSVFVTAEHAAETRGQRLLVADDEAAMRIALRVLLQGHGWEVDDVDDGTQALQRCAEHSYDALVLDERMPGASGLEVARALREAGHDEPIIIYSGYLSPAIEEAAAELGILTIDKIAPLDLVDALATLLSARPRAAPEPR